MARLRLFPYKDSPNMANIRDLAGIWSLFPENTKFIPRRGDILVNWGRSSFPEGFDVPGVRILNHPSKVEIASSKLKTLIKLKEAGVNVPDFTTVRDEAQRWLESGRTVFARTLDRSFGGRGIQVCLPGTTLPQAGLYTRYRPKQDEYRVHVWGGEILDLQQKKRRKDFEGDPDKLIRSWENGWVYCRGGVNVPQEVVEAGRAAVTALGLDFGACDIGFSVKRNRATCYEVNTAPGVENTTAGKYAEKLRALIPR